MPAGYHSGPPRAFLASNIVLAVLATLFFVARMVAKRMKRLPWAWDDSLLAIALFFLFTCVTGSILSAATAHVGLHINTTIPGQVERMLIIFWVLQFLHAATLTTIRCSISIFFLRTLYTQLFPMLRCATFSCIMFALAWLLISAVVNLLHCRPLHYNWSASSLENSKHCFDLKPYAIIMTAWGLILDGVTWSLPHFVVWRLQLRLAHKITITVIFALGLLNILMAVFRITSILHVAFNGDITYNGLPAMTWTDAQASTAIILACCPLLRPIFEKLIPKSLTHVATKPKPQNKKPVSIRVITRIDVHPHTSRPRHQSCFHDGFQETRGPTFVVERHRHSYPCVLCPGGICGRL